MCTGHFKLRYNVDLARLKKTDIFLTVLIVLFKLKYVTVLKGKGIIFLYQFTATASRQAPITCVHSQNSPQKALNVEDVQITIFLNIKHYTK